MGQFEDTRFSYCWNSLVLRSVAACAKEGKRYWCKKQPMPMVEDQIWGNWFPLHGWTFVCRAFVCNVELSFYQTFISIVKLCEYSKILELRESKGRKLKLSFIKTLLNFDALSSNFWHCAQTCDIYISEVSWPTSTNCLIH